MERKQNFLLIVDDDPLVARICEASTSMTCVSFLSAETFKSRGLRYEPAAVLIDIHLGENSNGLDLIPLCRERWPYTPIIVITAGRDDAAVSEALMAGANDFIVKPCKGQELIARITTRSKELAALEQRVCINFSSISFDSHFNQLRGEKGSHSLTASEAQFVWHLIHAKGLTLSKTDITRKIWNSVTVSDNAFDKKLFQVRSALKLVTDRTVIKSVYGEGIKLDPVTPISTESIPDGGNHE